MKDLEILFVGCGRAAAFHSRTLAKHFPEVGRSYLSRTPDPCCALARAHGGRVHEQGMAAALSDEAVDAVFVTTTPTTHLEVTLGALDAGKHVIVEKPAFLNVDEFDLVDAAAKRVNRHVLVAENYFYKPLRGTLSRIVEGGSLGQIRLIEINAVKRQVADGWRVDPALSGGGALFEGGVHWVSLMANLGLDIESCRGFFPDAPPGHERSAVFVAEYGQGATGVLNYSWEIPSILKGLRLSRIWGTRGSILFESNGLFVIRTGGRLRMSLPRFADIQGYRAMLTDFMRVLRTGTSPAFTLQAARRDVELVREGLRKRLHIILSHQEVRMSLFPAVLVGLAVGGHIATWGMYKDSIHEGFTRTKYVRSILVGLVLAPSAASVLALDVSTASGLVVLFGLTYALERAVTEFWKTFIRDEDQSKYFIPMQFHVMGRVIGNRFLRLAIGLGLITVALLLLAGARTLQPEAGTQGPLWSLVLVASIGGWYSAFGGAFKDAPIEGFETLKFFRSSVVAAMYGVLVSNFTPSYPLIALCAIGFTVATLETYKTFFFPNKPRGKFAGKPVLYPGMLSRRRYFVPMYVLIWAGVIVGFVRALATLEIS